MSLLSDFGQDVVNSIFDPSELADCREIGTADGAGGLTIRSIPVFWRTDILRDHTFVVNSAAYYDADVVLTIRACDLPREPCPNETIYSPRDTQWRIRKVENVRNIYYRLYLSSHGGA
jgi:hypothetical protein